MHELQSLLVSSSNEVAGSYIFSALVCLSVSRIAKKLLDGFKFNFHQRPEIKVSQRSKGHMNALLFVLLPLFALFLCDCRDVGKSEA